MLDSGISIVLGVGVVLGVSAVVVGGRVGAVVVVVLGNAHGGGLGLGLVVLGAALGRALGGLVGLAHGHLLLTLVLSVLLEYGGVGSGVLDHTALSIHHASVVGGDADTSSGVHTAEVELPTGLAERAGVAEVAADQGHAAVLAELELVGHLAADACGEAAGEAVGNNAHAAAAGVGLAGDGVALAAHLAAGAPVGIAALCHVGEASANGVVETGHRLFVV